MATLALRNLVKTYDKTEVLHGIELDVQDGEFVVFVGPSGCGKSTTLRLIAGLEDVTGGEILIGGNVVNNLEPKERDIAMVFQNYAIYPHMTVRKNIGFGLRTSRMSKADKEARIDEVAGILGMTDLLSRKPSQLSGGEQQRVAIARALVNKPDLLIADEPTGNLDEHTASVVMASLTKLVRDEGLAALIATHNPSLADAMDRTVTLKAGQLA